MTGLNEKNYTITHVSRTYAHNVPLNYLENNTQKKTSKKNQWMMLTNTCNTKLFTQNYLFSRNSPTCKRGLFFTLILPWLLVFTVKFNICRFVHFHSVVLIIIICLQEIEVQKIDKISLNSFRTQNSCWTNTTVILGKLSQNCRQDAAQIKRPL